MVTGRGPFISDTIAETLAHVMTREVDPAALPAGVPPSVRKLIARCLVKNPKQRLRDIGDARLFLDEHADPVSVAAPAARRTVWARLSLPAAIVLLVLAAGAFGLTYMARSRTEIPSAHLSIGLAAGGQRRPGRPLFAGGQTIAY